MILFVRDIRRAIKGLGPNDQVQVSEDGAIQGVRIMGYYPRTSALKVPLKAVYDLLDAGLGPTEIGNRFGVSKQLIDWHRANRERLRAGAEVES